MAIAKWLAKFKVLGLDKIPNFAKSIIGDGSLKNEIFKLLKHEKSPEQLDPVIHQLFSFYRLDNDLLQRFALEFLPTILCNYFISIYSLEQQNGASIEALLLGIYNMDAAKSQEEYLIDRTPPSSFLSVSSVYHNPMHADIPTQLTKVTLEKLQGKPIAHACHNLTHVESINSRNRLIIVSHSLMRYNQDIAHYSKFSHLDVCHLCNLLIKSTQNVQRGGASPTSLLPVSEGLISQLLHAVFFIVHNGLPNEGYAALENLYFRAVYDLLPHAILATKAVHNLLKSQEAGSSDGSTPNPLLASSITLPPPINKEAITAASFKPHILPEDIEVKDGGGKDASSFSQVGHSLFGLGMASGEDLNAAMKMRQKSVISKVFHIPKKREESEKRDDDKVQATTCLSPPPQSGNLIQFSVAKKALKNPFKSDQIPNTNPVSSLARLEFLNKKDTITITPYFSQLDSSETAPNLPISKADKKHKSKGGKLKRKHLRRAPSSSSSSSPKHSLSVSSYLSKDVIAEKVEVTKSDNDDEEEEDEQFEGQEENDAEVMNESDPLLDIKTKAKLASGNDANVYPNQVGRRQLLLRHITFATEMNAGEISEQANMKNRSNGEFHDRPSPDLALQMRRDSIPRLVTSISKSLNKQSLGEVNKVKLQDSENDDGAPSAFDEDGGICGSRLFPDAAEMSQLIFD